MILTWQPGHSPAAEPVSGFEPLAAPANRRRLEHLVVVDWANLVLEKIGCAPPKKCDLNGENDDKALDFFGEPHFRTNRFSHEQRKTWVGWDLRSRWCNHSEPGTEPVRFFCTARWRSRYGRGIPVDVWSLNGDVPWVHSCIHHSHLSTTHWVIQLHFLHQSFGRSIASVRDISGESCFQRVDLGCSDVSPCSDSDVGWFLQFFADVNLRVLESIDRGHSFPVRNRNRNSLLKSRWLQLCQYIQYGWIWCLSEDGESGKIVILRYVNWKMMINNLVFR